jgi:Ran GTPase-activating protein (RanGAP) involved in mRNA processing and transport
MGLCCDFFLWRKRESDLNDSTGTIDDGRALLSSTFLEFCAKVRNNDPSILPEFGKPFKIRRMHERKGMEVADALLENSSVTYLQLETNTFTKSSAEAMAKYVRTSKRMQRIRFQREYGSNYGYHEDLLCCFLRAFQESTSLKKLDMELPLIGGPSNLALEHTMTHTQSLQSLTLSWPVDRLDGIPLAAAWSGLKKNTTLRELTLVLRGATTDVPSILTSLRDHPLLRRLCLRGYVADLNGLETVLLSDNSKITELDIDNVYECSPIRGMTHVLQALGRRPTLTKLGLRRCPLDRDKARLLRMALCNIPTLQSLILRDRTLESAELAELAPALYRNVSIQMLDISRNGLNDMESAEIVRDILRSNKTITTLVLSGNNFGRMAGAFDCIAEGLGSNSTLTEIHLSHCFLGGGAVSMLAQNLGLRNTTLQKLTLKGNFITSMGVGVLLETMEQNSQITILDLGHNSIWNEGARLLARSLENNALPNLTSLSISYCHIGDDGFMELMSALEHNTSLLHLDLRDSHGVRERAFLALAESLPEIKVLQRVDFYWCTGLASAMPLLLAGLRKNTSLFRFYVANCAPSSVPPSSEDMARCAGGWMQEMERLGYRHCFRSLIRAPTERLPPRGVWPNALSRVATLPDVIFEVLRSKPSLVPSEDTDTTEDTDIP